MRFYLGTHQPGWLSFAAVPLFVSAVRLRMERNYRDETLRLCPTVGDADNAPLVIDRSHLRCLTDALAHYWRKAHPAGQREIEFPAMTAVVSVQMVPGDQAA